MPSPMYFELNNDKSSKFWEISNLSPSKSSVNISVRYGKIGNEGITKVFSFSSVLEANHFMDKKILEKKKKGYILVKKPKTKTKTKTPVKTPVKKPKTKTPVKKTIKKPKTKTPVKKTIKKLKTKTPVKK